MCFGHYSTAGSICSTTELVRVSKEISVVGWVEASRPTKTCKTKMVGLEDSAHPTKSPSSAGPAKRRSRMLDVTSNRRSFLKVGALALGGLTLPGLLAARARGAQSPGSYRKSVILIWQAGGPSHIDMYDLKPNAPSEVRGEFKPISTVVPGIQISEHLPHQAKVFDKMAVVRSATHTNAGHGMGSQWMLTGYQPTIEVNDNIFPSTGSVVAKMRGSNEPGLPAYVNLPHVLSLGKAAYLGASYNPFAPDSDPNSANFQVRNLKLPGTIDAKRLGRRRELLGELDKIRRDIDTRGDIDGLDSFYREGLEMVTDTKAQRAFDIKHEPAALRERYGRHDL